MIEIIIYLIVFCLPGYIIISRYNNLNDIERITLSLPISIIIIAGLSLLMHICGYPLSPLVLVPLSLLLLIYSIFFKIKLKVPKIPQTLLLVWIVAVIMRLVLMTIIKSPLNGDEFVHFSIGKSFLGSHWASSDIIDNFYTPHTEFPFFLNYRPPLYNFVLGFAFSLFGTSYPVGQILTGFFGAFLVFPTYLISRKFFGKNAAALSSLLVSINPFLVSNSVSITPKIFAAFFILNSIYFGFSKKEYWHYFSMNFALAYLSHYTALWFFIPVAVHHALKHKFNLLKKREVWLSALLIIILLSPWFVRNAILYGNPFYSTTRYIPILPNWFVYSAPRPPTLGEYLSDVGGLKNALAIRLINIVTSYFPPPPGFGNSPHGLSYMLRWNLSGIISPLVFILGAMFLLVLITKKKITHPLILTVAIPSLVAPLAIGWVEPNGVATPSLYALVPIFSIAAIAYIEHVNKRYKKYLITILILSIVANSFILYSDLYSEQKIKAAKLSAIEKLKKEIPQDSIIMSNDAHYFSHYLKTKGVFTPYAEKDYIYNTINQLSVDYLIVVKGHQKQKGLDIQELNQRYKKVYEDSDYIAFHTSG